MYPVTAAMIKHIRTLHTPAGCRAAGMYLLEGEHLVHEALAAGAPLEALLVCDARRAEGLGADVPVYTCTPEQMRRACETVTPQGICAVVRQSVYAPEDICRAARVLVLDGLQDPGNTGTLLRTAEACGFGAVLLCGGAYPFSPKVARSAMGATLRVRIAQCGHAEALTALKQNGHALWAMQLQGDDLWTLPVPAKLALCVGSEGAGVSEAMAAAARAVTLPMAGGTESLNAAVAGAVGMYQIWRAGRG